MSATAEDLQAMLDLYQAEFNAAWYQMTHAKMGDSIRTGFGGSLKIVWRHYGHLTDDEEDAVIQGLGTVRANEVLLTEDGGTADTRSWHQGPQTGESVYVERWDAERGRYFHGYVDPTSRKVVQTG